ncbi:MAG: ABC transporter ATP-binding protein [Firmicutes bacterium]|nr:ABC transporter ATP-binding protein [Bacillota bacterium]
MEVLTLDKVSFSYNGAFAMTDISLGVKAGDFTGIIGPNGSGKSTLLKLMAGYLRPDSGRVLLAGQPVRKLERREMARRVAVVSQGVQTGFAFTVEEMVRLGRLPHLGRWSSEGPGDARAVERALALTQLEGYRTRLFSRLSGGEAQRVLVAQALAQEPEILLLDEPTTYLDMAFQQEMFTLMAQLNREGITVVAVLHDVNMAALYCKELVAIKAGKIFTIGTPDQVITRENILAVYGCSVEISKHPLVGRPQVTLLPGLPCSAD